MLVAACRFDADYEGGMFTCSDGVCPAGLTCVAQVCVGDAGVEPIDGAIDARVPALTCSDPGILPTAGGMVMGTTAPPRMNLKSSFCNSLVMNGPDAIYRVDAALGQTLQLTIEGDGSYPARAYVLAPCGAAPPATPACIGNTFASEGSPASIAAASTGPHFVVVDGENAGLSGAFTLTVTITN